jgi:flagellar motility protein MotE (MotC chaperone)
MIRSLRDLRLIPIVLFATISLFALKSIGLLINGHYALDETRMLDDDITGTIAGDAGDASKAGKEVGAAAKADGVPSASAQSSPRSSRQSWAQQMFNYPETTGTVEGKKDAAPPKPKVATPEEPPKGTKGWKPVPIDGGRVQSPAEIAVLERLQERRAELDARAKEVEMRESLLKAAEKRLEGRLAELKDLEARVNNSAQQRDEAEAARFKNVVTMYETMKPKEAAKIFDRLELKILVEVAKEINPRRMSDILAQMTPDAAQQLTVELAAHAAAKDSNAELPKIEGKPGN